MLADDATRDSRPLSLPGALNLLRRLVLFTLLAAACGTLWSYGADQRQLAVLARGVTAGVVDPSDRVLALMAHVHAELPSRRNPGRFCYLPLGATPLQILEHGGDCADKSRLLVALLRTLDISATPVMSFDTETGLPAHTFVEARLTPGGQMAVDPAFALAFPREAGGYFGLLDLRRDPAIVDRRLAQFHVNPREDSAAVEYYLRPSAPYDSASTYNWDRNVLTRAAHAFLAPMIGEPLYAWPRPALVEEPKLAVFAMITLLILLITVTPFITRAAQHLRPRATNVSAGPRRPPCTGVVSP